MKKEPQPFSSMIWIVSLQNVQMLHWKCVGVLVQERKATRKTKKILYNYLKKRLPNFKNFQIVKMSVRYTKIALLAKSSINKIWCFEKKKPVINRKICSHKY